MAQDTNDLIKMVMLMKHYKDNKTTLLGLIDNVFTNLVDLKKICHDLEPGKPPLHGEDAKKTLEKYQSAMQQINDKVNNLSKLIEKNELFQNHKRTVSESNANTPAFKAIANNASGSLAKAAEKGIERELKKKQENLKFVKVQDLYLRVRNHSDFNFYDIFDNASMASESMQKQRDAVKGILFGWCAEFVKRGGPLNVATHSDDLRYDRFQKIVSSLELPEKYWDVDYAIEPPKGTVGSHPSKQ